jgi:lipopolysaccharide export system permease protein
MDKLRHYLLSNLSLIFFSIFLPLFAIASVIFLIKLATYTSVIKLSLAEMGKLYLFVLPDLFFYTLPIAFVVGAALTFYRLSNDNEMVAVFSLGISPIFLVKVLAKPALLLSLLLFIDFLVVAPYINIVSGNFIKHKKDEAQFNIAASEFGHSFGDWMLFINKSNNENFEDIVLFNKEIGNEIVIHAKSANLLHNKGILQLQLTDGESYSYDEPIFKQITFKTAYLNDVMTSRVEIYRNTFDYWTNEVHHDRKIQQLITDILLSLFPILSLFFILSVSIVQARHQKRWIYLWLFLSIVVYYTTSNLIQQIIGFHALWVVPALWLMVTYKFYTKQVEKRF